MAERSEQPEGLPSPAVLLGPKSAVPQEVLQHPRAADWLEVFTAELEKHLAVGIRVNGSRRNASVLDLMSAAESLDGVVTQMVSDEFQAVRLLADELGQSQQAMFLSPQFGVKFVPLFVIENGLIDYKVDDARDLMEAVRQTAKWIGKKPEPKSTKSKQRVWFENDWKKKNPGHPVRYFKQMIPDYIQWFRQNKTRHAIQDEGVRAIDFKNARTNVKKARK